MLKIKTAAEVAHCLMNIFFDHGPPSLLQTDNGAELSNKTLMARIKQLWTGTAIVHGRPRQSQDQGSVERANGDFKNMLHARLKDVKKELNQCVSELPYVQYSKNNAYHSGIRATSYRVHFGRAPTDPQVQLLLHILQSSVEHILEVPISSLHSGGERAGVLEEDIHQAVCHLSHCLGIEHSQDDELAEAVLVVEDILVPVIWYHLQIHQVSLPALPNSVWDDWLVYNLVRALPPSCLLTYLAEMLQRLVWMGHMSTMLYQVSLHSLPPPMTELAVYSH